jgi:hypothetical protein
VLRDYLAQLGDALRQRDDWDWVFVDMVSDALKGTEQELQAFLVSNELWGGAGSIADQAGFGPERDARRRIHSALVNLGEAQIKAGLVNARTETWVSAFKKSQEHGT